MFNQPTIIIDTREQRPFLFKGMRTVKRKLEVGDYSVRGLTHHVTVERKSKADLFSTMCGKNRARFENEVRLANTFRMSMYIVVEAPLSQIYAGCRYSKINPYRMVDSLMGLCVKWSCQVHFLQNRLMAEKFIKAILTAHWREAGA